MTDMEIRPNPDNNPDNAQYELECRHVLGSNERTYYKLCDIIKVMPDGRLKIQTYGDLFWPIDSTSVVKIRRAYVDSSRVYPRQKKTLQKDASC